MKEKITAQQIIDRIKDQCGISWKDSLVDVFNTGNPDTIITGITVSFAASIEVLRQSVSKGKNLIVTFLPAFYQESSVGLNPTTGKRLVEEFLKDDPTYLYKSELIDANKLIIWNFHDNWIARGVDGQLKGLSKSLGWDEYHILNSKTEELPYNKKNNYFIFPEISLKDMVVKIQDKLNIQGIRVIGDPKTKIKKASLSHGMCSVADLQQILKEPDVDLIVIGEPIEWEASPYFQDMLAWGKKKGMIILGQEVSEEPGSSELASWLKTFIPEVSIEWIPAGEPFWIP